MSEETKNKFVIWLKKYKRLIIGLSTLFLIILMIFLVDFRSFIDRITTIGIWGTFLFVICYSVAFLLRAYKLKFIFIGLDQNIRFSTSIFSIGACFVINDLTPGKVGDIAKIFIIKDQESKRLSESVAAISIERVLDLIFLFLICSFTLVYLYIINIDVTILGQRIQFYLIIGAILIILLIIFFLLLLYKTELVLKVVQKISKKLEFYVRRFLINFKEGIKKFRNHKKDFLYIVILSFPTWIFDAIIIVIFFYFSGYAVNVFILILAAILLFFSKTFPITPGGWGISENIGALFVSLFYPSIPYAEILSLFIIDHLFRSVYLFFYGGYSIFHYNYKLKEIQDIEL
ncbi:MAG: lysylphosphatidylglycerol synthase transmembrane domain-containing protein [Candidatus Hodarchaeota archaeon]